MLQNERGINLRWKIVYSLGPWYRLVLEVGNQMVAANQSSLRHFMKGKLSWSPLLLKSQWQARKGIEQSKTLKLGKGDQTIRQDEPRLAISSQDEPRFAMMGEGLPCYANVKHDEPRLAKSSHYELRLANI